MAEEEIIRVRIPQKNEILGIVKNNLGGSRFEVKCNDGFTRICRIPGKLKKNIWIRVGDLVIVKPWEVQSNERGDIIWMYTKAQAIWLEKKGFVKSIE
ncbi:MAG: translation initiation factor eIF-1A [Candidatus Aenigmatarchaeota archaeon]